MATIRNPPPRPSRTVRGPDPGSVNITHIRLEPGDPFPGWAIRVGPLHIGRRHIDPNVRHLVCQICADPYDHHGQPHDQWQAQRAQQGRPPIQRGEAITGPDGNVYNWTGSVWIQRP